MRQSLRTIIAAAMAAAFATATPAHSQDSEALVGFNSMKPELAVELAQAAVAHCRDAGYQVAVAVVDRFGQTQAVIRDRYAGVHTVDTAIAKAWTAASFRTATLELDRGIEAGTLSKSLRDIPGALILGGGVPVAAAGSIIGAVGVSGAPGPEIDEGCAKAGIAAISERLEF
ncbi:MAG TPA: heme-binding protein [Thermohalobaculum sp.]|nr:heme-binding protein [Thermohalobaculum sp.]